MGLRQLRWALSALLVTVSLCAELTAQTTTSGGLAGVVTDPSGAVVPGADVEIKDLAKGVIQTTKTDREGVYRFSFVAPAKYVLTVTRDSFRKESRAVVVLLGPPVSFNLELHVAQATTDVTVVADAPLLQAENGDFSTTMNQQQVSEVPNPGGDITYVAQTAPGMMMNTEGGLGNFSSLGMPGTSNVFTLDGMSQNDNSLNVNLAGSLGLLLGQNQIQEATVVGIGYSGQFGGAAGANVNFITKSGSNKFHGNAVYYWNGNLLNANDWFNNAFQLPPPFDIANQWAGSLGGPIKKDKLFFFFDTEGVRLFLALDFPVVIPSPQFAAATIAHIDSVFGPTSASDRFYKRIFDLYSAAPGAGSATSGGFEPVNDPLGCTGFADPNDLNGPGHGTVPCAVHFFTNRGRPLSDTLTSGRVDWNATRDDRAFLRVQYDRGANEFGTDPINSLFDAFGNDRWWQGQLIETHTFGSSGASQFLLGGYHFSALFSVANPSQTLAAFPTNLNFASGTFNSLGGSNLFAFPTGAAITQYQTSEDVVKIQRRQKLAFGASFERIYWTFMPCCLNLAGTLTPQTLGAFYEGGVDPASGFTLLDQAFATKRAQRIAFYTLGLYGQDEWHARSNLTLTLALRAEHRSNPVCKERCFARLAGPFASLSHDPDQPYNQAILINQKQAFAGTDNILWSPRFGFAWQPFGVSHNTVVRGGVGIFYDQVSGALANELWFNPPLVNSYSVFGDNLTPGENTNLFKDTAASNAAFINGFAAGQTMAQIQATISSFYPPGFIPPAITNPQRKMLAPQYLDNFRVADGTRVDGDKRV